MDEETKQAVRDRYSDYSKKQLMIEMMVQMEDLRVLLKRKKDDSRMMPDSSESETDTNAKKKRDTYELSSGVVIKMTEWEDAKKQLTASQMVKYLLPVVFDLKTLLVSNYKGGASKREGNEANDDDEKKGFRKPLDSVKINAIKDAVMRKHDMTQTDFGIAVNTKLNQLRGAKKNQRLLINEETENGKHEEEDRCEIEEDKTANEEDKNEKEEDKKEKEEQKNENEKDSDEGAVKKRGKKTGKGGKKKKVIDETRVLRSRRK